MQHIAQHTVYWTEDAPLPELPIVPQPEHADVAIIGGGYTGLHAAHALARHGANVVVLEAHEIGWGASSRNGGMVNPGLKLSAPELFCRFGERQGEGLWRWSMDAINFTEQFIAVNAIQCHFARHGQVVLAYKPRHFTAMRREAAWHQRFLSDSIPQVVGPAELQAEIGSASYYGGLRDERAGGLHPAKYVAGLARTALVAGACILSHTPVRSLHKTGKRYILTTPHGRLTCNEILLATNGYTNNLVPPARRGIFAAGSYIVTTEPLPLAMQQSVSPKNRMFYDSKHFLNYFRLTPDGRMLFGGRHNLSIDLPLDVSRAELGKRMVEIFPQLDGTPISHSWTGKLGLTFDLMPHAGRLMQGAVPGIFFAYGYGGHGVAVAGYLGHMMGEMLAGMSPHNPVVDVPHRRYFFTSYEKLYLPLVSMWFRFLDKVS